MYKEEEAKKLRCPNVKENCVGEKCMAWEWVSMYEDIIYEDALTITDASRKELEKNGYIEVPAHGLALDLKVFFPITEEEKSRINNLSFGTQLLFGKKTTDKTKWIGKCSSCSKE